MKKVFLTLACVLSLSFVFAQGNGKGKGKMGTPEEIATKKTDEMGSVVTFTGTQKDQVYASHLKLAQDMASVKKQVVAKYPDKETRKASKEKIKTEFGPQMKTAREAHRANVDKILTAEQKEKWKTYKKDKKGDKEEEMEDMDE